MHANSLKYKRLIIMILCILIGGTCLVALTKNQWGLQVEYFDNPTWHGQPVVKRISSTLSVKDGEAASILGTSRLFTIRWRGWIVIAESGNYRFATQSDDGSFLFLDGNMVIDNGGYHGLQKVRKEIFLNKGVYPIEIKYLQGEGSSVLHTYWEPPEETEQFIPDYVLFAQRPSEFDIAFRRGVLIGSYLLKLVWVSLAVIACVTIPLLLLLQFKTRTFIAKYAKVGVIYVVYLFVLLEISSRTYLMIAQKVPFFHTEKLLYKYYPQVQTILQQPITAHDDYFDILILGGSVVQQDVCNIEPRIQEYVQQQSQFPLRFHHAAYSGHSSLDSLFKYQLLSDIPFDLVLFYHGINEVRTNNCPSSIFQIDYSHYTWYQEIGLILKHQEMKYLTFPYVAEFVAMRLSQKVTPYGIPNDGGKSEWQPYGKEIKSAVSFQQNVTQIVELSQQKREPLLLLTFASYVPDNYSVDKFANDQLDYADGQYHCMTIETWGLPQHVISGIHVHNEIIRQVTTSFPTLYFFDMSAAIPQQGKYFCDICHFSVHGCQKFSDILAKILLPIVNKGNTM